MDQTASWEDSIMYQVVSHTSQCKYVVVIRALKKGAWCSEGLGSGGFDCWEIESIKEEANLN